MTYNPEARQRASDPQVVKVCGIAMESPLTQAVRDLSSGLQEFLSMIRLEGDAHYPHTIRGIEALSQALVQEFDLAPVGGRPRNTTEDLRSRFRAAQKALVYRKQKADQLQEQLRTDSGSRLGNRIRAIWFVRTGLARPTMPARSLSELCAEFPIMECHAIGETRITLVRDAFCEMVKACNRDHVRHAVCQASATGRCCIYMRHTHDEASMRLKSYAFEDDPAYR